MILQQVVAFCNVTMNLLDVSVHERAAKRRTQIDLTNGRICTSTCTINQTGQLWKGMSSIQTRNTEA